MAMSSGTPRHTHTSGARAWQWARIAAIGGGVTLVAALLLLLDLRADRQRRVMADLIARSFDASWLDRDAQPPRLFDEKLPRFEHEIRERYPSVHGVYLTRLDGASERLIYPDRREPQFHQARQRAQRVEVRDAGGARGFLYIDFDPRAAAALRWTLRGALALVSVGGAAVLLLVWRQARAIEDTRVELAERTQELYHLERLALVGRAAAGILHDLKKPVLNIRQEAQALADPAARAVIGEQSELFFALLRELDLEGFAARTEDQAEFLDLEQAVARSYALVERQGRGVHFRLRFPAEPVLVLARKHRVTQIFSNLFLNALEAMPHGGELEATCDIVEEAAGRCAVVAVRDSGAGIAPEHLGRIFEPFRSFSGRNGATGLGLYITRQLVRDLGGEIAVSSEPGRGAVFTVRIPLEQTAT